MQISFIDNKCILKPSQHISCCLLTFPGGLFNLLLLFLSLPSFTIINIDPLVQINWFLNSFLFWFTLFLSLLWSYFFKSYSYNIFRFFYLLNATSLYRYEFDFNFEFFSFFISVVSLVGIHDLLPFHLGRWQAVQVNV